MAELEEEDLTKFDQNDLIAVANKVVKEMAEEGATKERAEKLRKVALELGKKSPESKAH
jgi:hypothetical protein